MRICLTTVSVSDIEAGTRGFFINSVPRSINFGTKIDQLISPAGDVNGDGFDDFLVSVADFSGSSTFLIFGGNFNQSVTTVSTSDINVMLGSANDEIIYAGLGDDTLYMSAGDDRLSGARGAIPMWPKMSAAPQPSLIFNLTVTLCLPPTTKAIVSM